MPNVVCFYIQDYTFNVYLYDRNLHVRDGQLVIEPIKLESKYGEDYVRQSLDLTARYLRHYIQLSFMTFITLSPLHYCLPLV